jgi:ABC-2 type transport system permease protein
MTALIRGELIKTVTTRTLFGYAAIGVALMIANVLIVTQFSDALQTVSDKQEAIAGLPILLMLLGLVGAAGEYRHRTAAPAALAAGRSRGLLVFARAGAYTVTALAVATVMVAVSLAVGLPLLASEPGRGLGSGDVAAVAGGSLFAAALSAIMGVAVGALVRNQVAAVIGTLIVIFVVTPLLNVVNETAIEFLPWGAAAVLAGEPNEKLSWGGAAVILAAWTAPLLIAAIAAERRRDVA